MKINKPYFWYLDRLHVIYVHAVLVSTCVMCTALVNTSVILALDKVDINRELTRGLWSHQIL